MDFPIYLYTFLAGTDFSENDKEGERKYQNARASFVNCCVIVV